DRASLALRPVSPGRRAAKLLRHVLRGDQGRDRRRRGGHGAPDLFARARKASRAARTMTGEPRFDRLDARYEIIEKIAQGGMGTIYRVHDHALGRTVAMKVCSIGDRDAARGTEGDRTETARFLDEARITARLDHPGIIPV